MTETMKLKDRIEKAHRLAVEQRKRLAEANQRGTRELMLEAERVSQEQAEEHPAPKRTMTLKLPPETLDSAGDLM